ncbi:MAG: hypothetical protein JWM80_5504 [Cyanobacteria bacterium RYN_339]|nr:hypothetical protein [Cyanobacteria bacterium RYN_339]
MTEPIRSLDPVAAPLTPARPAVTAAPAAPAAPEDRLALSGASLIEADVAVRLKGKALATANGTVKVDHRLVDSYARRLFEGNRSFKDVHLAFDAAQGRHIATGTLLWHGLTLPYKVPTKLVAANGKLGLQFDTMHVKLFGVNLAVPDWLARRLMGPIAQGFGAAGISSTPDPQNNRVMVDANSLMREIRMLPEGVNLDTTATSLDVTTNAKGDIAITLKSADPVAPARSTPGSDLAIEADRAGMADALRVALGDDYNLTKIEPSPGGFTMRGDVEYKPLSDTINAFQGLFAAIAIASGDGGSLGQMRAHQSRGPLDLAVRVNGTKLSIKPHTTMALDPVAEALGKAGFAVKKVGDRLEVDLRDLLAGKAVTFDQFELGADGVTARAHLNLDQLLPSDKLEGRP